MHNVQEMFSDPLTYLRMVMFFGFYLWGFHHGKKERQ